MAVEGHEVSDGAGDRLLAKGSSTAERLGLSNIAGVLPALAGELRQARSIVVLGRGTGHGLGQARHLAKLAGDAQARDKSRSERRHAFDHGSGEGLRGVHQAEAVIDELLIERKAEHVHDVGDAAEKTARDCVRNVGRIVGETPFSLGTGFHTREGARRRQEGR